MSKQCNTPESSCLYSHTECYRPGSESNVTSSISMGAGTFLATPTAHVGNVITENGEYYKAMLVLENVTTSNITIRVVNVTSSAISFSGAQWKILAIGAF